MSRAMLDKMMIAAAKQESASAKRPPPQPPAHCCRFCGATLERVFVDLGVTPLCESYLSTDQLAAPEPHYRLAVYVCDRCLLVQLPAHASGEQIFSEYAYFSSFSTSYLAHARQNVESLIQRFQLDSQRFVVELACNDGYLLRNFVERRIPCLGIEPAANVARAAEAAGIRTWNRFFGAQTARDVVQQIRPADVIIANNVLAHVPELNDFMFGIKTLLAPDGVAVVEVQHLLRLIERSQFDTIYHEHFCYYTLQTLISLFQAHGLAVFDVEEIATHGGSLRVFARHWQNGFGAKEARSSDAESRLQKLLEAERAAQLNHVFGYAGFAEKVADVKRGLLEFLTHAKQNGRTVAGYGAPGKGNTLLNYCGIGRDLLPYTVDRNPYKQGKFLPGSHLPIYSPERIDELRPDYVLILPWNLREEISAQLAYVRAWGGKFIVPIPHLEIW